MQYYILLLRDNYAHACCTLHAAGITCFCSIEPNPMSSPCYWDNDECTGDKCYVRRALRKSGQIQTTWGCLDANDHIDLICNRSAFNNDNDHYTCCDDRRLCNQHLEVPVLQIERPTPSGTSTGAPLDITTEDVTQESGNGPESSLAPLDPSVTDRDGSITSSTTTVLPVSTPAPVTNGKFFSLGEKVIE